MWVLKNGQDTNKHGQREKLSYGGAGRMSEDMEQKISETVRKRTSGPVWLNQRNDVRKQ